MHDPFSPFPSSCHESLSVMMVVSVPGDVLLWASFVTKIACLLFPPSFSLFSLPLCACVPLYDCLFPCLSPFRLLGGVHVLSLNFDSIFHHSPFHEQPHICQTGQSEVGYRLLTEACHLRSDTQSDRRCSCEEEGEEPWLLGLNTSEIGTP